MIFLNILLLFFITNNAFAKEDILTKQSFEHQELSSQMTMEQKRMQHLKEKMYSDAEIERVAREYEEVAVNKMLQQLNEGVKPDPIFGGGHAEEIYRDMLIAEHAKILAKSGGIGIAESIKKDMIKINNRNKTEVEHGSGK